jgi:hypothetical protein
MVDKALCSDRLEDLQEVRTTLEQESAMYHRLNVPFHQEGQKWLKLIYKHETKLYKEKEEAQTSVTFL